MRVLRHGGTGTERRQMEKRKRTESSENTHTHGTLVDGRGGRQLSCKKRENTVNGARKTDVTLANCIPISHSFKFDLRSKGVKYPDKINKTIFLMLGNTTRFLHKTESLLCKNITLK